MWKQGEIDFGKFKGKYDQELGICYELENNGRTNNISDQRCF